MRRDSHAWYLVAGSAWLASLATNPAALEKMLELDKHAWASAFCQLIAIVAALMKASPLDISEQGRKKYLRDRVNLK